MTLAATLYLPTVGEREMLMNHLDKPRHNYILVLYRGYPANWLIAALLQQGIVRVKPNRSYPRTFTQKPNESYAYK